MTFKKNTLFVFPTAILLFAAAAFAAGSLKPKPEAEPGSTEAVVAPASGAEVHTLARFSGVAADQQVKRRPDTPDVGERGGEDELTCSLSETVDAGNMVTCPVDETSIARCFPAVDETGVVGVRFGVEAVGDASVTVTVSLYEDTNGCPPTLADLVLLGQTNVVITPADNLTVVDVVLEVSVGAGTNLVVDLTYTVVAGGTWLGGTFAGQTCPTYIRSVACGLPEYDDLVNVGFPDAALIVSIDLGEPAVCGDGSCAASEDCCSCAADCGACPCGDGNCTEPCEDCESCSQDCGDCSLCLGAEGDCCDPAGNGSAGCNDLDCCDEVCGIDPFCCNVEWDATCAAIAENTCLLCFIPPEDLITCSTSKDVLPGSGVSCVGDTVTSNQYARCMPDAMVPDDVPVELMDFGVEVATNNGNPPMEVTCSLFSTNAGCGSTITDGSLTLLGSSTTTLVGDGSEALTIQSCTFDPPVIVPAGTDLVAQFSIPDDTGWLFWPGANPSEETCTSYLSADPCGIPNLTDVCNIGFCDSHFVINLIIGEPTVCGDGSCEGAENCCGCEADCGACACGDGTCNAPCEDCGNCQDDCDDCPVCFDAEGECCDPAGNGTPGCNDSECCEIICDLDAFCCNVEWDDLCASFALINCPLCETGGPVEIATGPASSVDGYLMVAPDEYGAWASTTFGGAGDSFNPSGPFAPMEAAFTSGLFLFVGDTQRELLTDNDDWQGVFPADSSLDRVVTSDSVPSDTNDDGVDDTLVSSFRVFGGGTDLSFDLTQHVFALPGRGNPEVSVLQQEYQITNNGDPIDFVLVATFDGDLLWVGDFDDDSVGTGTNGMPGVDRFVYEQEAGQTATAITLSSPQGDVYYGAKLGIDPSECVDGGVPYGFGTDVQIWEAFGVPDGQPRLCDDTPNASDWRNHIAGVGYTTDGDSGASPPGCGDPCDGSMGLQIPISLPGRGVTTTITILHTYGSNEPPSTQIPAILSSDPPNGAIDARQPASLGDDCATPAGWDAIDITFDMDAGSVVAGDFTITVNPADMAPPSISGFSSSGNTVSLTLDGIIPTGHWTIFTHDPSGTSTMLGNLPADVNGDGTSGPVDILDLIDHLNGVIVLPEWGTDADRSGVTNPADILTVIDLLNGAGCFDPWNGVSLP